MAIGRNRVVFKLKSMTPPGMGAKAALQRVRPGGAMAFADPKVKHPRSHKPIEDIAAINELGNPNRNLPARPMIGFMMETRKAKYFKKMYQLLRDLVWGSRDANDVERRLGVMLRDDLQKVIREWKTPKNAPRTIKRKGFDDPMIETGLLQRSIKWRRYRG